jgi:hypothetical protein
VGISHRFQLRQEAFGQFLQSANPLAKTNLLEQAIDRDDGGRAATIIQNAPGIDPTT